MIFPGSWLTTSKLFSVAASFSFVIPLLPVASFRNGLHQAARTFSFAVCFGFGFGFRGFWARNLGLGSRKSLSSDAETCSKLA